jgi:hypothetical protein
VAVERKLSLSAIKSRASRARNMLKERLLMYCQVELSAAGTVMDCYARSTSEYRKDNCCPPYST